MEDLLKKISQYQIFNFLLSGTVLAFIVSKTTPFNLLQNDTLLSLFVYYFMGFIVSRIGSLLIEPLYKRFRVIKFVPYEKYLRAVKKDKKIDVLSQENNTYRTLIGTFIVYMIVYLLSLSLSEEDLKQSWVIIAATVGLVLLLTLSYRKQTKYITSRVNAAVKDNR